MSDNKKYYYMKLKENFFDSDEMIILESMTDGYLYSNILMKLYLRSLKDNGRLMFKGVIPYTPDVLGKVLRHNVGVVEKAIQVFKQLGLIEILDNGAIYMLDIQNFIGESSTEADRIRAYRKKVDEQKLLTAGQSVTDVVTNVRTDVQQMNDKSTPEIDIEIKKDKKIKEPKKEYADYVFLTETEYGKLTNLLGEEERESYFLRFAAWISGRSTKEQKNRSAYLTILNWHRDDQKKPSGNSTVGKTGQTTYYEHPSEKEAQLAARMAKMQTNEPSRYDPIPFGGTV